VEEGGVPSYSGLRFAITPLPTASVWPHRITGRGKDMVERCSG
jgi:hypothetical protein